MCDCSDYHQRQYEEFLKKAKEVKLTPKEKKIAECCVLLSVLIQGENLHGDQRYVIQEVIDDLNELSHEG